MEAGWFTKQLACAVTNISLCSLKWAALQWACPVCWFVLGLSKARSPLSWHSQLDRRVQTLSKWIEKESQTINLKIEGSHRWAIASGKELRQNGARQFKLMRNEPMNSLKREKKTRHADLHCPILFTNTREKNRGRECFLMWTLRNCKTVWDYSKLFNLRRKSL